MKFYTQIALGFMVIGTLSGCHLFQDSSSSNANSIAMLRSNQDYLLQQINQNKSALQSIQEQQNQIMMAQQQMNSDLSAVRDLKTMLQSDATNASRTSSEELAALKMQIKAVDEARIKDCRALADAMSKQINSLSTQVGNVATAQNALNQAANTARSEVANALPQGEYYKHKVDAGQTLGQISQAYGVSIAEIQKINKLKSTTIRLNQILLIPKRK